MQTIFRYEKIIIKSKRRVKCLYSRKMPGYFYILKRNDAKIGPFLITDTRFENTSD